MLKFLRSIFGLCKDRWLHDWVYENNKDRVHDGSLRACGYCGSVQKCRYVGSDHTGDEFFWWGDN